MECFWWRVCVAFICRLQDFERLVYFEMRIKNWLFTTQKVLCLFNLWQSCSKNDLKSYQNHIPKQTFCSAAKKPYTLTRLSFVGRSRIVAAKQVTLQVRRQEFNARFWREKGLTADAQCSKLKKMESSKWKFSNHIKLSNPILLSKLRMQGVFSCDFYDQLRSSVFNFWFVYGFRKQLNEFTKNTKTRMEKQF